jgi:hypothetical protein
MYTSMSMRRSAVVTLFGLGLALGCDSNTRGRDASAPLSLRVSEVSIRIDAASASQLEVSLLAFRAQVAGLPAGEVLGVVDPVVASPPEGRCELREVAGAARNMGTLGATVELEEMSNVSLELGPGGQVLRPSPHVYPQLAPTVGGVIGEAGPVSLPGGLPQAFVVSIPGFDRIERVAMDVPPIPRLLDGAGNVLAGGGRLDATGDLPLVISGGAGRAFLEIRPLFGASYTMACPVGAGGRVVVPRDLLARLTASNGWVPLSFDAVLRDSRLVNIGGQTTRVSIEARSAAVLDLRATGG